MRVRASAATGHPSEPTVPRGAQTPEAHSPSPRPDATLPLVRSINFARRFECYHCRADKPSRPKTVPAVGMPGSGADPDAPVIMVKGLSDETAEGEILVRAGLTGQPARKANHVLSGSLSPFPQIDATSSLRFLLLPILHLSRPCFAGVCGWLPSVDRLGANDVLRLSGLRSLLRRHHRRRFRPRYVPAPLARRMPFSRWRRSKRSGWLASG